MMRLFLTFVLFSIVQALDDKEKSYGLFDLNVTNLELCKGPKHRDCGVFTARIKENINIEFDYLITDNFSPTKAKVLAISNGNEMLRLKIDHPCNNLFLKPVLQTLFNITNNCVIKKGRYTFTLDFQDTLRKYYGGMHLYGNWIFRSVFFGSDCNFSCSAITVKITEKH